MCKFIKNYEYHDVCFLILGAHCAVIELIYRKSNEERETQVVEKGRIVFFTGPNQERFEVVERILFERHNTAQTKY